MGNKKAVPLEVPDDARIRCGRVFNQSPPPEIVRFINAYGGENLYGEPNFRLVWGAQRRHWKTRVYVDKDENGHVIRRVPECRYRQKYPRFLYNWVLEYWRSPLEFGRGDPDQWRRENTLKMHGEMALPPQEPFPSRGDYELLDWFGGDDGGPLEILGVKHSIDRFRALRAMTETEFLSRKAQEAEKEEAGIVTNNLDYIKHHTPLSLHNPWLSYSQGGGPN